MNLEHLKKCCGKCGAPTRIPKPLTDEDIRPLAYAIYLTGRNQCPEQDWFDAIDVIERTLQAIRLVEAYIEELERREELE